jgi:rhodanese-related sulfurtransferase
MHNSSNEIDVQALARLMSEGVSHTVLDVREPVEIEICAIENSLAIPMQQIPGRLDALPRNHPLIVLCHHGTRSRMVTNYLRGNGFDNALNLDGGIDAWARTIAPGMARY